MVMEVWPHVPVPGSLELQLQQCPLELLATKMTSSGSAGPVGNAVHGGSCCAGTWSSMNIGWLMPTG